MARGKIVLGACATAISVGSCSLALQVGSTQCSTDADCAARGLSGTVCQHNLCAAKGDAGPGDAGDAGNPDADPKWSCVGHVTWASPVPSQPVKLAIQFLRLINNAPVPDLALTTCDALDPSCSAPLGTAKTDVNGKAIYQAYQGFDGYLLASSAPSFPDMIPGLVFRFPPPDGDDLSFRGPVPVTSVSELDSIAALVNASVDPTLGHVFARANDCTAVEAAGVSLALEKTVSKTLAFYITTNGLPSNTQTETGPSGEGGFINVPPGLATLHLSVAGIGQIGTVTVTVRAGDISYVNLAPPP